MSKPVEVVCGAASPSATQLRGAGDEAVGLCGAGLAGRRGTAPGEETNPCSCAPRVSTISADCAAAVNTAATTAATTSSPPALPFATLENMLDDERFFLTNIEDFLRTARDAEQQRHACEDRPPAGTTADNGDVDCDGVPNSGVGVEARGDEVGVAAEQNAALRNAEGVETPKCATDSSAHDVATGAGSKVGCPVPPKKREPVLIQPRVYVRREQDGQLHLRFVPLGESVVRLARCTSSSSSRLGRCSPPTSRQTLGECRALVSPRPRHSAAPPRAGKAAGHSAGRAVYSAGAATLTGRRGEWLPRAWRVALPGAFETTCHRAAARGPPERGDAPPNVSSTTGERGGGGEKDARLSAAADDPGHTCAAGRHMNLSESRGSGAGKTTRAMSAGGAATGMAANPAARRTLPSPPTPSLCVREGGRRRSYAPPRPSIDSFDTVTRKKSLLCTLPEYARVENVLETRRGSLEQVQDIIDEIYEEYMRGEEEGVDEV